MKKTIFRGKINDQEFDSLEEFQKHLAEVAGKEEIKNISFSTSLEEVAEQQKSEKTNTSNKLYPNIISPDEFLSYAYDYDEYLDEIKSYLLNHSENHKQAIEQLSEQELRDHLANINRLHLENNRKYKITTNAQNTVKAKIDDTEKKVTELKDLLETYHKKNNDLRCVDDLLSMYASHFLKLYDQTKEQLSKFEKDEQKEHVNTFDKHFKKLLGAIL